MSWLVLREQVVKVGECLWEPCLCLKGEEGCEIRDQSGVGNDFSSPIT